MVVIAGMAALMSRAGRLPRPLGVQGTLAESMLVDLRDRIFARRARCRRPPQPWCMRRSRWGRPPLRAPSPVTFGGGPLGRRDWFEVALVDVSGKGLDAGTRALLLSGAFGSLLGAMDPEDPLGATNSYLFRARTGPMALPRRCTWRWDGQPEEGEAGPRGRVGGEQVQGERGEGSGSFSGGNREEGSGHRPGAPAVRPATASHRFSPITHALDGGGGDSARQCHRPRRDPALLAEQRPEARDVEERHSPVNRLDPRGEVVEAIQDGVEGGSFRVRGAAAGQTSARRRVIEARRFRRR